ncbi:MAG: hypothetical protein ACOX32_00480 [Bacteroidaceae bacterium]|jgi:hypothetical protein|nr:hypothetical protein [Bacteroidaceae bacterium]
MKNKLKGSLPSAPKKASVFSKGHAFTAIIALSLTLFSSSCNRDHSTIEVSDGKVPLVINVNGISQSYSGMADTKAVVDLGEVCTNLSCAIYTTNGETTDKIQINQSSSEESFGTVSTNISVGLHKIVVVAHSGDKNPTMTNPESISFSNTTTLKTTDVFCWSAEVDVTAETGVIEVNLVRVTAMFRLVMTDSEIPSQVVSLNFRYTGGSAALNPSTGEGTTKSTQNEAFTIETEQKTFEVYTIPRFEEKDGERVASKLKITISAIDEFGNNVKERVLEDVPVTKNRITRCSGEFFEGGCLEFSTIGFEGLQVEQDWEGIDDVLLN